MVTFRFGVVVTAALVAACSGRSVGNVGTAAGPGGEERRPRELPPDTVDPGGTGPSYPGTGFRVHEWGTNTVVVGSNGSLQRGLHHEEEDLPSFVYDRTSKEVGIPSSGKMETPVVYFYAEAPLRATVSVEFPEGILTQWYPWANSVLPFVIQGKGDPALDRNFPYSSPACRDQFAKVRGGSLGWGEIEILARSAQPSAPDAPLDRYTWSHARAVAANAVRTPAESAVPSQEERFLFYRGLGNFPLDVRARATDETLTLTNESGHDKVGAVFVLHVDRDRAAFTAHAGGIEGGATLSETTPAATEPLDAYAQSLAKAMVSELDKAGLYHDESIAMVKTWARQWFRTPGVRVLYLAPRAATDRQIPLSIRPAPEELVRVMVIRMEVLTPAAERADLDAAAKLDGDSAANSAGRAHFASLGRFAEPRLRRAMQQVAIPYAGALSYLDSISGADVSLRAGE